ncbi:hypothetical protein WJX84_001792 [Apatococcus fuscideae]|uniref:W2 domain-containing protein n=1 Tax=Apatococcus fuscideae TaxID=2026836 RepID=A0AAW1TEH6_9CHLO
MASINIGADNQGDAFYRYKMPRLVARIEGRGNGIRTNVVNNVDIAKALERPPEYTVKYFGCELGAQTKFDKKQGTSIVNGAHESTKLSELLEGFIKKYVQCYSCGNPETTIKIKKDFIFLKCKACGGTSEVDMRHRLNTFIIKNPPEEKISKAEKKLKKAEKERLKEASGDTLDKEAKRKKKKEKERKKKGEEDGTGTAASEADATGDEGGDDEEDEKEVVWMTDTSEEAAKKRAEEQLSSAMAGMVHDSTEAETAEAEAEAKRQEKQRAQEHAAAKAEEERKASEETAKKAAADKAAAEKGDNPVAFLTNLMTIKTPLQVATAAKELDVEGGPAGRISVLFEALFLEDQTTKLAAQIKSRKAYLKSAATDPASAMAELIALEHFVGVAAPKKIKEVAGALQALYDEEIVDEALILAWFEKATAGKILGVPAKAASDVRRAASPFIEWLREADEGGDEEEEDDDEDEDDED